MKGYTGPHKALHLLLLGVPGILWQDEHLTLPRRQARALLYRLAASPGPVSRQHICFLFWADQADLQARRNLNRLLSYVRHQLPDTELLLLQDESVQLNPELCSSDLLEFNKIIRQENPDLQNQAAHLVRGPFLDGFYLDNAPEFEQWVAECRAATENDLLQALGSLAWQAFRSGDLSHVVEAAQRYLSMDNLSEEYHCLLMQAYAGSGNRPAAMRQYEQLVATLESELGVAPLPETQALQQAIAAGNYHPLTTPNSAESLQPRPGLHLPLTGREHSLAALSQAIDRLSSGGVVFIHGEAGIGKTRLLKEFASSRPGVVVVCSNYPASRKIAFHAVRQAFQQALHHRWLWSSIPPIWLCETEPVLPEVRNLFPNMPTRLQLAPGLAQLRLLEALTQVLLEHSTQAHGLLLVMDDVQWLDSDSQTWLVYLIERLAGSQITLLVTYRSENAAALHELRRAAEHCGCRADLQLDGLDEDAVRQLLLHLAPAQPMPPDLVYSLWQATAGNPFYLLEILDSLLEKISGQPDSLPPGLPVPERLSEVVKNRLERLPAIERQVIEAAAVSVPYAEPALLQAVAGRNDLEISQALEALTIRNYLQSGQPAVQFRHEIVRECVYQSLSPWRKELLHRRTAQAFDVAGGKFSAERDAWQAYHFARGGLHSRAVECYVNAATEDLKNLAFQSALNHVDQALKLSGAGSVTAGWGGRLLALRGNVLSSLGRFQEAQEAYQKAIQCCNPQDRAELSGLHLGLGNTYLQRFLLPEADQSIQQALAALGTVDSPAAEKLYLEIKLLQMSLYYYRANPEAIELAAPQIEPLLARHASPGQQIHALALHSQAYLRKHRYRVYDAHILANEARAFQIAQNSGLPQLLGERYFGRGMFRWMQADPAGARTDFEAGIRIAHELQFAHLENQCLVYLLAALRQSGEQAEFRRLLPRGRQIAHLIQNISYLGAAQAHTAWLARLDGEPELARSEALAATVLWEQTPTYPFQWLAWTILLELYVQQQDWAAACTVCERMEAPLQQWLGEAVHTAFSTAIRMAENRDTGLPDALFQVVKALMSGNYL